MSKDGFPFANPVQIEKLMIEFEKKFLAQYTPCNEVKDSELALALGIVHVELIVIHPFREGNGRTTRLLADLMSIQAGRAPLNYAPLDINREPKGFREYISAIHMGFINNYKPIQQIFLEILNATKINL